MNIKYLRSLQHQKFRDEDKVFVAEGVKTVSDIMSLGFSPLYLLFCEGNKPVPLSISSHGELVPYSTIERISGLKTPQQAFAVFKQFQYPVINLSTLPPDNSRILFLDTISDPGNLGTIIRTADWFGFNTIVCSNNTADIYNPKVIQASMGAIANMKIHYVDTVSFLKEAQLAGFQIFGTFMDGEDIHSLSFPQKGIFIIGNEGNGISLSAQKFISRKISIPDGNSETHSRVSESLNAAVAAAILAFTLSKK